jgi:patatin-like phospholipase/acyl hydrolase
LDSQQLIDVEDGGGIRGYSSLLILEALMKKIAELEKAAQLEVTSMNQSNGIAIHDVEALDASPTGRTSDNTSAQNPLTPLPLPCHYFDYFFGTSTGGYVRSSLGA